MRLLCCRVYTFGFDTIEAIAEQSLVVKAFDHDKLSFHDSLGDQTVALASLLPQLKAGEKVPLTIELNDGQKQLVAELEPSGTSASFSRQSGAIQLDLIRAEGLKAADKNGLSDPYVTVSIGDRTEKSKVFHKTLNPQFDW